jgi:hypothetical protein
VRDQSRQPPWHSCRVWQFEFLCKFASDGNLCHRPSLTLRLDVPGYFDYTSLPLSDLGPYDVTADGKTFLINSGNLKEGTEPLTLVLNWPTELKK